LKTGEFDENVYLKTPTEELSVHAPGMLTGTTEVALEAVLDITSICSTVYGFTTDEQIRSDTYNGIVNLKTKISEDPATLMPLALDVVVAAASGNSRSEWEAIGNDTTLDGGKKNHQISKGVVTTVKTVFASATFIQGLPKMTEGLVKKLNAIKIKKGLDLNGLFLSNIQNKLSGLDASAQKRFLEDLGELSEDALQQLDDNFELLDEWAEIDKLAEASQASRKPEWLKKIQAGNEFNRLRASSYPYNEIYIKKSTGTGYYRLDSYKPGAEIVSRKFTQFDEIRNLKRNMMSMLKLLMYRLLKSC